MQLVYLDMDDFEKNWDDASCIHTFFDNVPNTFTDNFLVKKILNSGLQIDPMQDVFVFPLQTDDNTWIVHVIGKKLLYG